MLCEYHCPSGLKVGVPVVLGGILAAPVLAAAAGLIENLLVVAFIVVYTLIVLGVAGLVVLLRPRRPARVRVAAPAVQRPVRALPAAVRAIEAPRVIVVRPEDVLGVPVLRRK
jgi:hypothetical protein